MDLCIQIRTLGTSRLPARLMLLNAKCIQRSPPETCTPKTRRKEVEMKYTKTIFFYLDDEELKDLDEEADIAGITRSEYVRRCINETVMKPTVNINYVELTNEANELVERFRVVADHAWHSRVLDVPMFRKVIQDTQILMTNIKNELIKEINHEKQK